MILDTKGNAPRYKTMHDRFTKAIEFLGRPDLKDLPVGRHEIDGDQIYALVIQDFGRKKEDGLLEIHRDYIDIHAVLDGIDEMGWKPTSSCREPAGEYDPQDDAQLFSDQPDAWVCTHPGQFVIFFPEDAHMPMISSDKLHKVVIKVAC